MKAIRKLFARLFGNAQPSSGTLPPTRMPRILKGVGKINGDGWKDTTRIGEIVYVWDLELPKPYMPGQYPRIGNEIWSASTRQYDFTDVPESEYREVLDSIIESVRFERSEIKFERDRLKAAAASRAAPQSRAQKGIAGNSTRSEQRPAAGQVTAAGASPTASSSSNADDGMSMLLPAAMLLASRDDSPAPASCSRWDAPVSGGGSFDGGGASGNWDSGSSSSSDSYSSSDSGSSSSCD
ncbi:hypothetical protein [Cupriavidus necator]|uniref:hypothetical protein n=1 Tax=Cupriavidus necator TaxID=106590 RepID=UPI0005B356BB|nr:hypothetical protein [Cupriavidus necator]